MSGAVRFDQKTWQAETTWEGPIPPPDRCWELLHAPDVDLGFTAALDARAGESDALKAMLVQHLAETGSIDELATEVHSRIGRRLRESTIERLLEARLERSSWKIAFANLVSGRFTELVFDRAYRGRLEDLGLELIEETVKRNFLDFRLVSNDREGFALSLNTKNAGVQMAQAESFFGLAPEDTLPMATYKTFGAEGANIPPLLYVYLVDWSLIERLRHAYWLETLTAGEQDVFRLMTSTKGFSRGLEDDFVAATVERRLDAVLHGVGYSRFDALPFRVVSAAKCQQVFYLQHRRSPYVFVKRMNTDPNVHISISSETISFDELIERHLSTPETRRALLAGLARRRSMEVPDPPI